MRLKQLTINNYGIYKGENTFSFPYSTDKKVSIIIGKNGSGKTTFLSAIKICLFGSMILKNRTITKSYESYILEKLNKNALKEEDPYFAIKATFISQLHNYDGEFTIERIWDTTTGFKENVNLLKNGEMLSVEEQASFFNALYHAFPLDLFELFYLDGEKIDQLSILNANIFSLIESSINIDLFKKLRSDLLTYASKRVSSKEIDSLNSKFKTLELERDKIKENIQSYHYNCDISRKNMDIKADEIKNFKDSLNIEVIDTDTTMLKELEQTIIDLKRTIEFNISKFLPYSLVTDQLIRLLNQLSKEMNLSKNTTITSALKSTELNNFLKNESPKIDIQSIINKICEFYPTDTEELIFKLNDDDFYSLKSKISSLLEFKKDNLHDQIKKLDIYEDQYFNLTKKVSGIEAIKASGQLDNLLALQSEYDDYKSSLLQYQEKINESDAKLKNIEIEIKTTENALWTQLKKSNITKVLEQIHAVLDEYIYQIKAKKIKEIEQHTKKMFDLLIRKAGFINNFKIENDDIYLLDKNNNRLNHSNLSAGEKQIFVLSLIYAILQSSERRVPLMFDTLLGRLDQEHRDNVFKKFISSCPDQVIILATDSELANIDKKYLASITNTFYTIDFSKSDNQMTEMRA